MVCHIHRYHSDVECSPSYHDFVSKEEIYIVLTESGIIPTVENCGVLTRTYEVCEGHFQHLLSLNLKRSRRRLCLLPSFISSHPDIDHSIDQDIHAKSKRKRVDRTLSIDHIRVIQDKYGIVLAVNTPVCLNCRLRVCKISQETCTDVSSSVQTFTANQSKTEAMEYSEDVVGIDLTETVDHSRAKRKQDDAYSHQEISEDEFYFSAFSQETQMSSQNNSQSSQRTIHQIESLEKLNSFLLCEGLDTISMPTSLWASYSRKTQLSYMKKISECIRAIVMTIFEEDVDIILQQLASYDSGNYESSSTNTNETDTELLKSLADSYSKAESWQIRRQILSVISIQLNYNETEQLIPGLSEYRYYAAKKHSNKEGCGMPPKNREDTRNRMDHAKLDSFLDFITSSHVIKDLPFGERKLKLQDGKKIETPNIIRCMGPAAIVDQYKQYCKENDFNPLGDSTMFKILSECTATMRKSLEGLDYYLAEGVRAFRELEDVLAELHKMGSISLECKRYLKVDYKVHISETSNISDHCRKYALSSQDQDHFHSCCDHDHDHVCEHCEQILELLHAISKLVNECQVSDKDIYLYKFSQAKEKILNWKCHIIRSRNQGAAKSDLLDSLEESEISQDSVTTTSVILDIVEDLNTKYEDISKVHLWSDNAGCYKCTDTINAIAMSGKIAAYNFCEAQDGKGACDRTAATLKAGIRRYINQGNDVTSASQMKKAIESTVKNVKYIVKVVDSKTAVKEKSCLINIPAISSLNNFLFLDEGIKVWRHFSIGECKLLPKPQNYSVNLPQLNIINACSIDVDFHTLGRPNTKVETAVDPVLSGIFTCETDGCVQSFNTYKELEEHHLVDKCVIIAEKHPKFQKVQLYVDKLNTAQITQRDVELAPANVIEGQNRQAMGWALKATRLNKRFSEKQKNYLIAKFNIGLQTGNKEDPDNVAEEMKYATQNGSRMFASTEFLTPLQISSFFSRHARKTDALRETLISEVENSLTTSI
ncbi:unnamed protein product [Mytilus coruscus]|uniref:C2H2-type domain-containing protein n=1 Tax=Mytilus coruscus TaxID=42192 RepID=A0A6J8CIT8_MYTCO|nr:unnamed protein product [Mytilus coruscus]